MKYINNLKQNIKIKFKLLNITRRKKKKKKKTKKNIKKIFLNNQKK